MLFKHLLVIWFVFADVFSTYSRVSYEVCPPLMYVISNGACASNHQGENWYCLQCFCCDDKRRQRRHHYNDHVCTVLRKLWLIFMHDTFAYLFVVVVIIYVSKCTSYIHAAYQRPGCEDDTSLVFIGCAAIAAIPPPSGEERLQKDHTNKESFGNFTQVHNSLESWLQTFLLLSQSEVSLMTVYEMLIFDLRICKVWTFRFDRTRSPFGWCSTKVFNKCGGARTAVFQTVSELESFKFCREAWNLKMKDSLNHH